MFCLMYIHYIIYIYMPEGECIPYTAKLSSGKTFTVGIENECSRENLCVAAFIRMSSAS